MTRIQTRFCAALAIAALALPGAVAEQTKMVSFTYDETASAERIYYDIGRQAKRQCRREASYGLSTQRTLRRCAEGYVDRVMLVLDMPAVVALHDGQTEARPERSSNLFAALRRSRR